MNEPIIHFWQVLATSALGVVVTLIGFWVSIGRNIVNKDEISKMILTQCPYSQDRQLIMERLASNKESQTQFASALQRNTEVMNELKVQLATLGKTLEALEERIEGV